MNKQGSRDMYASKRSKTKMAILCFCALLLCGGVSSGSAEEGTSTEQGAPSEATNTNQGGGGVSEDPPPGPPPYEYQTSARPDPFKPFIAPKTVNPNELIDEVQNLTGMQLFEPEQLTLVGVMDTPSGRVAMVEDVTKKGYRLTEGELIGRRGQVTEIRRDQLLITETVHTRGGEEIKSVVSMKLKRDGEGK